MCSVHKNCISIYALNNGITILKHKLFYLTMYLTYFVYSYMASDIKIMVKDHSDSKRKPSAATSWATLSN